MKDALAALLRDAALRPVWDALPEARVVGGAVRDALIGRPVADIDLATPRLPAETMAALNAAGLRAVPTGIEHGTVTALSDGRAFEVTTLRRDVATDGRHATVAFTDDWQADAARRDLTFNAMSLDRGGVVADFFDGRADLAAGRVRFVGDPATRIAEDYLRVLRYFRFLARYGREAPEPSTLAALRDGVPGLARLSPERVWSELKRILLAPDPVPALRLMRELGVLAAALPEAASIDALERLVGAAAPADPLLRMAALIGTEPLRLLELQMRLRLSGAEAERLAALTAPQPELREPASDGRLRSAVARLGRETVLDRLWLAGSSPKLRERVGMMPRPVFPLRGRDLVELGMQPGAGIGETLQELEGIWHDGGCVASREALLARLPDAAARTGGGEAPAGGRELAGRREWDYPVRMDTMNPKTTMDAETGYPPRPETETVAERQARIAWEAERIAEARASVAAGRVVSSEQVDAWINSLGTEHELPVPRSGR